MSGLGRAQITRLIQQYRQGGERPPSRCRRHRFARKYTPADSALPALLDEAHDTLSSPATGKILEREYKRPAGISLAQIYRLRRPSVYRRRRLHFTKARPAEGSIGPSRRPSPASCASIRCAKAIATGSRASITSMLWMK